MPRNTVKFQIIVLIVSMLFYQLAFAQDVDQNVQQVKLQATLTPPYVIGPGDQLSITDKTLRDIIGSVEQYNLTVSPDGYISIPLPDGTQNNLLVAGLTIEEVSEEIRELFSKTLINPLVFVQISKFRPINVYIAGEVQKPGIYKIESTTTDEGGGTLQQEDIFGFSLTEAIQLAGGFTPKADITSVTITRGSTSEKRIVNFKDLVELDSYFHDINLQPGDVIYVASTMDSEKQAMKYVNELGKLAYQSQPVTVLGEVRSVGRKEIATDATIFDAIADAGGPNVIGTLDKVKLTRYDENGNYKTYKLNVNDLIKGGISQDQWVLKPNDIIEVDSSKYLVAKRFVDRTLQQSVPLVISAAANAFAGYIVQDNFFSRITMAQQGSMVGLGDLRGGGGGTGITIIGGAEE